MLRKERYTHILKWFQDNMPDAKTELNYTDAFSLICAVSLSAQCTDKRINMVIPALMKSYPTPEALASAKIQDVKELIYSVSFPNNKSKHLIDMAKQLVKNYHSVVPSTVEEIEKLPGCGRKTANVVTSIINNNPVIAVDTHVFRVSRRIGLTRGTTPLKVEKDLTKNIPKDLRAISHHWLILHGRYICKARKPLCNQCGITKYCAYYEKMEKEILKEILKKDKAMKKISK
ncbi:MAG: endonuclease III [Bacteroidales bacterium]